MIRRVVIACSICLATIGLSHAQAPYPPPSHTASQHATAPASSSTGKDKKSRKDDHKPIAAAEAHNAILWQNPGDIASKNLLYGLGGDDGQPKPPFTFLDEDKNGSNPKFDVRDASGTKWRAKLGPEARPEVTASRLLWAIGYFTDVDYVLPNASVSGLHMHRGHSYITNGDQVSDVRFARKPDAEKRIAGWAWKSNPFIGTREFNGLRVIIAVLNSFDLKNDNNAVYLDKKTGQQIFLVSDTGASLGTNTVRIKDVNGKGNAKAYAESRFITDRTATTVNFATPGVPNKIVEETGGLLAFMYLRQNRYIWIGRDIPRADARWIGSLLGQLSHQQLVDAFRAGNFTPQETKEYVATLEQRIAQLKNL
ncbi:MAG TPA: hypothetical protein VFW30_13540 [Bryocella sp.]|nr:hypothetical protein [Bryocella sp.]